ncbi:MAG: hypothetical protein JWL86_5451 [Rhizobium sp.]|nr:hypothetical protein [Rhizobium sp.]
MTTTSTNTLPATRPERSVEDWKYIVGLYGRTIEMNGAKTAPVILKGAAEAIAEYEAAAAREAAKLMGR